jgi:hypothetical protein
MKLAMAVIHPITVIIFAMTDQIFCFFVAPWACTRFLDFRGGGLGRLLVGLQHSSSVSIGNPFTKSIRLFILDQWGTGDIACL